MISVRPKQEGARVQKVEEICFHSWSTSLSEFHRQGRVPGRWLEEYLLECSGTDRTAPVIQARV